MTDKQDAVEAAYRRGVVDGRKEIIAKGCIHTARAAERTDERPDILAWQEAQGEWHQAVICEIVSEYAEWRDEEEKAAALPAIIAADADEMLWQHRAEAAERENERLREAIKTLDDRNLEILVTDLRPYANRALGSLRIDMSDVRSILAMYDALAAIRSTKS